MLSAVVMWVAVGLLGWAYLGYPVLVALFARLRPVRLVATDPPPRLTVAIAVHDEAAGIADRIADVLAQMAPLVLAEGLFSLIASVALVSQIGPIGAAVASFLAVGIANGRALPVLDWRIFGGSLLATLRPAWVGIAAGGLIAGLGAIPALLIQQRGQLLSLGHSGCC